MKNNRLTRASENAIQILLVEDNPADVRLTLEIFRECQIGNELHVARDGEEATAFLHRQIPFQEAVRPDLILLDLNLPGKSGHEVLMDIKRDPDLQRIPVVILTTSKADKDIEATYNLHANCYILKPVDLDQFTDVVRHIEDFWLSTVRLPPR